jgi:hypothetical protein
METQGGPPGTPRLDPAVCIPEDGGLPRLDNLFDKQWVWRAFCAQFGEPEEAPDRIRALQCNYRPGARALVNYAAEWQRGRWVVDDQFSIEMTAGKPDNFFHYPDDPYLPGLPFVGGAVTAPELLAKYVGVSPRRLRVEAVRYRPATRAVLRHIVAWRAASLGSITLFVRVMPPRRLDRLISAADLAQSSGFTIPPILGVWPEGGVVWMASVPGETLRGLIRTGTPPDPRTLLNALSGLWERPLEIGQGHPLDVWGAFEMTKILFMHLLVSEEERRQLLGITDVLGPFAKEWQPSAVAHNDFYDDQLLVTPEGELALVDFEEIGPGDPLLDVANMLAHLRWMERFGNAPEQCNAYRIRFRSAALAHLGCTEQALRLREAYALFRLSAGPFRQLQRNWSKRIHEALELVSVTLAGAP